MALVLCTDTDPVLMETRRLLLEKFGHHVITAGNETEVKVACCRHIFDVAVIGQGASAPAKKCILRLIRASCPAIKVLELYTASGSKALHSADSWLQVPADLPETLPTRVTQLATLSLG